MFRLPFFRKKPKAYDPALYKTGQFVRIRDEAFLENFLKAWQYHHKLQPEQLPHACQVAKVEKSGMYHGGDILYELVGIPGIWHEQCLMSFDPARISHE